MMRQIFRWTVVIGVVLGALYYAEAGGGGGGGNCGKCITNRVRFCNEEVACGPPPACVGGCRCEEFNHRWCDDSVSLPTGCKGVHTGLIPTNVFTGECTQGALCTCRVDPRVPGQRVLLPQDVCTPC